jgi:RimJ/RimL family protein N-acetyltransferase
MRHLMPIVTPRLILRPPTLRDLDSIQTAKEEAWPDLQRWMSWAFDNQRSRQAMEDSIRRMMDYQNQAGIALAGFHRINGDFVVRTALDLTDEQDVYETGYWVAPKYAGQGMATEAANAAIRYAFGHLARRQSVSGTSIETGRAGAWWRNWGSRSYAWRITRRHVALTGRNSIAMSTC